MKNVLSFRVPARSGSAALDEALLVLEGGAPIRCLLASAVVTDRVFFPGFVAPVNADERAEAKEDEAYESAALYLRLIVDSDFSR